MKKTIFLLLAIFTLATSAQLFAHCQVPCGIFTDDMRISIMNEHADTILRSMNMIEEISKSDQINYNQLVRWVNTKEYHADDIIKICSEYYLCQRIIIPGEKSNKEATELYDKMLKTLHRLMVTAMKCKQGTDVKNVELLKELIHQFSHQYMQQKR